MAIFIGTTKVSKIFIGSFQDPNIYIGSYRTYPSQSKGVAVASAATDTDTSIQDSISTNGESITNSPLL